MRVRVWLFPATNEDTPMPHTRTIALSVGIVVIAAALMIALTVQQASAYTSKNDLDRRPVDRIAAELGIEGQQFADCFAGVTPDPDFNPTPGQERANKAILLPCLQKANPAISNDLLDQVMNKYRGQHI
jgi:hypothetical protein